MRKGMFVLIAFLSFLGLNAQVTTKPVSNEAILLKSQKMNCKMPLGLAIGMATIDESYSYLAIINCDYLFHLFIFSLFSTYFIHCENAKRVKISSSCSMAIVVCA
ncbi:MAG: hypothetical protein RBT74_15615 [Tenuifilaceae bacterium]|nr:hypothetical protein [Tenuifilaceae bacterium]